MTKVYNHITEDEKIKLARITQDCLDTHVFNPPKTFVNLAVLDKNGQEIERHEMLSKSWVRNFYNLMFCCLSEHTNTDAVFGSGHLNRKNTAGSVVTFSSKPANRPQYYVAAAADSFGIVVGIGDTAESFDSYALANKISTGNGAGQLAYSNTDSEIVSFDSESKVWTNSRTRYFNNNSGSEITVKEVGLYMYDTVAGSGNYMTNRDLLAVPVAVPNGGQLKVTYIISQTFPE